MKFSRISGLPNKVLPHSLLGERVLDDYGYLWWHNGVSWDVEKRIIEGGGQLIDVQGEPTLHQGSNNDVAVTPKGKCWSKIENAWEYEADLGEGCEQVTKTESLIVLGNLSLAVVDGQVLLFDSYEEDKVIGCLRVYPVR